MISHLSLLTAVATWSMVALGSTHAMDAANLHRYAKEAVSDQPSIVTKAIHSLRESGPRGLDALFEMHAEKLKSATGWMGRSVQEADDWKRLAAALDAVGKQKDCYASHLYWYTDFDQAKKAARASGKPILSLRLLGNLDEEFSCANSRFFRTVLYANKEISQTLRERFVLHWKSVRPAPRVTVDFGDGRKLERTITGNSIHYILDPEGQVVDALPGLYGPKPFLRELKHAEEAVKQITMAKGSERESLLRSYHTERLEKTTNDLANDLAKVGVNPTAQADTLDAETWRSVAQLHAQDMRLDEGGRNLMRNKTVSAKEAARVAFSKSRVEDPLLKVLLPFERSLAEDTVGNQYVLHAKLHKRLAAGGSGSADELNEWVYANLFLTPSSDPWLGLASVETYSALEANGLGVASRVQK